MPLYKDAGSGSMGRRTDQRQGNPLGPTASATVQMRKGWNELLLNSDVRPRRSWDLGIGAPGEALFRSNVRSSEVAHRDGQALICPTVKGARQRISVSGPGIETRFEPEKKYLGRAPGPLPHRGKS